jgi:hypothetical protein
MLKVFYFKRGDIIMGEVDEAVENKNISVIKNPMEIFSTPDKEGRPSLAFRNIVGSPEEIQITDSMEILFSGEIKDTVMFNFHSQRWNKLVTAMPNMIISKNIDNIKKL